MRLLASCSQLRPSKSSNLSPHPPTSLTVCPRYYLPHTYTIRTECPPLATAGTLGTAKNFCLGSRPPCPICATPWEYSSPEVKASVCGPLHAIAPSPPFPSELFTA